MTQVVEYQLNKATEIEIAEHLRICEADFIPPLSGRVEINDYAQKIARRATRFEAWSGGALVGLVAAYCNDLEQRIAYITSVSVLHEWNGKGIAAHLMKICINYVKAAGLGQISLEVGNDNVPALKLYERHGFVASKSKPPFVTMDLYLKSREQHE